MGNGVHAFHDPSGDPARGFWYEWWYDEYGVKVDVPQTNPAYGQAMSGAPYTGWLGQPLTPAYQPLATAFSSTPDLISANQGFETTGATPSQIPNWNFVAFAPGAVATALRDTTTAGEGVASLRVQADHLNDTPVSYGIQIYTGSFSVTALQQYSVTFKAKASGQMPISVGLGNGPTHAIRTIQIDSEWRQYQFVVESSTSAAAANVRFDFGLALGTYWIDDIHVQLGATSVWRRDFQRGIVLVNPARADLTVVLEKPYRKIQGTVNPALNDGSTVAQVTLAGTASAGGIGDAAFLLTIDETSPAAVLDLRSP
jgi:hypothetical protein